HSEVTDNTTRVLLECALFEPKQVRRTRTALGLSTDASYRFERGVDPDMMRRAVQRAASLILQIAGGKVLGATDVYPVRRVHPKVTLRAPRVPRLLGVSCRPGELQGLLEPIAFATKVKDGALLDVTVPGHRSDDVTREVDLIEEVARRHGYDNFPAELLPF